MVGPGQVLKTPVHLIAEARNLEGALSHPPGLYSTIVARLESDGRTTPYAADANEPDPRYLGYGVRAPAMKKLIREFEPQFRTMSVEEKVALARQLIESGYGEQKTVALRLLDDAVDYFTPEKFDDIDYLVRHLHGWSKVDAYTGSFLRFILSAYPTEFIELITRWNADDDPWLRRASVVIFTRKVARSGVHTSIALQMCDNLKHAPEDLVLKGVGWCLKDHMLVDKQRVLDYVVDLRRQKVSSTITLYALRGVKGKEREAVLAASQAEKKRKKRQVVSFN